MKALIAGAGLSVTVAAGLALAQTPTSVDGLVSAAKLSAGLEWPGTFLRLCVVPPPAGGRGRGTPPANAKPAGPPARSLWYAEPAKVADNFYFIGTKVHNAWALVGSDGIIVFEALFDYAAPDEIADGMRKLGLDASRVKYVVISHAHGDHDGGAALPPGEDADGASRVRRAGLGCGRQSRRTGPAANRSGTWSATMG